MAWVAFASEAAFTAWHDAKCAATVIPRPGSRQTDGKIQLGNQWTTAYVMPIIAKGVVKADIPAADVAKDLLTPTTAPVFPDPFNAIIGDAITPVAVIVTKPLPATWLVNGVPTPVPIQAVIG